MVGWEREAEFGGGVDLSSERLGYLVVVVGGLWGLQSGWGRGAFFGLQSGGGVLVMGR